MSEIDLQKEAAFKVVKTLQSEGFLSFFAGGCVRDRLLGRIPKDYDVATAALPEEVETLFPKTIPIGKAFGVIAVVDGKETVEVATFREEMGTLDGRHPKIVLFSAAKEDALRRDFTINGMFYDPIAKQLHDYVHGQHDLEKKIITAIGDPTERFKEDHLRMLRAVRFSHNLGFALDPKTEEAARTMAPLITKISAERIEMELSRTLTDSLRPGDALTHLHQLGFLEHILPEILPMVGQEQSPLLHPEGDVFKHTVLMLNLMNEEPQATSYTPRELAYAILLHDAGKPSTARVELSTDKPPQIRFDDHAAIGAEMAAAILTRLKFPTQAKKNIVAAIRGPMRFMDAQKMRISTLRKMIGAENFDLELELHRLDSLGSQTPLDTYTFLKNYIEEMAHEPILPEPWICGHDLISMGITEGKRIGEILKEAYDAQLEDQFASRDELLGWIRSSYPSK